MMMFVGVGAAVVLGFVAWRVLASTKPNGARGEQSPEEALKQRFARGEIDEIEFERRMGVLHPS
jgi:uncharacterized membrane protein